MPTINQIILDIIEREGSTESNHPADAGGRTKYGISARSNPDAWKNGPPTLEQAKAIYLQRYVQVPRFQLIRDPAIQAQLIDYGVTSGPQLAIMKLQTILGVNVDGILGPQTLGAMEGIDAGWLNNQLMVERLKMVGRIVARDKSQAVWVGGWINRIVEFLV